MNHHIYLVVSGIQTDTVTNKEINDLVQAFLHKDLPIEKWTHEAHIITAIWHLKNF